ncbi:hypothetical protein Cpir12675_004895 [Ceratocystis pirilliformis]|uniref:Infection structure specific protein n=1 Tax=Ceratocystis pirilliformis TaxID=259994 RepID=A0ABR3YTG9_9PEZI
MHYLKSLLALTASVATASAMAAPHPMITPAPKTVRVRRDIFDDLGDVIEDGANSIADTVEDAANDVADGVDDIGNDISRWGSSVFTNAEQSATCISLASAIVDSDPPRPTEDLRDLLEDSQSSSANNCLTSVPASLTSEYSAYETSAVNWYSSASSLISSYQASCPTFGDLNVQRLVPCSTIAGIPAITSDGSASGSSRTSGASSTSTSTVTGSAPRNGGMAAGALVALVGVIALF